MAFGAPIGSYRDPQTGSLRTSFDTDYASLPPEVQKTVNFNSPALKNQFAPSAAPIVTQVPQRIEPFLTPGTGGQPGVQSVAPPTTPPTTPPTGAEFGYDSEGRIITADDPRVQQLLALRGNMDVQTAIGTVAALKPSFSTVSGAAGGAGAGVGAAGAGQAGASQGAGGFEQPGGTTSVEQNLFRLGVNVTPEMKENVQTRGVIQRGNDWYSVDIGGNLVPLGAGLSDAEKNIQSQRLALQQKLENKEATIRDLFEGKIEDQKLANKQSEARMAARLAGLGQSGVTTQDIQFMHDVQEEGKKVIRDIERDQRATMFQALEAIRGRDYQLADNLVTLAEKRRTEGNQLRQQSFENQFRLDEFKERKRGTDLAETNRQRDDARSAVQFILDRFAGADLASLPDSIKNQFAALEQKAGYPTGFTSQGLQTAKQKATAEQQRLAAERLKNQEEQKRMDQIIKVALGTRAGTTNIFPGLGEITGLKTIKGTSTGLDSSWTQTVLAVFNANRGEDGKTNPALYAKYKDQARDMGAKAVKAFETTFPPEEFLNPDDATAKQFFQSPAGALKGESSIDKLLNKL